MAINKFMMAVMKALSHPDYNLKKHYKFHRAFHNIIHPKIKVPYVFWSHNIAGIDYNLPVRIFTPDKMMSDELILYFHGGGWVMGDTDSYAKTCFNLANKTGRQVYLLEYRLAPEHQFPCSLEDCYAIAKALHLDRERIVVMGDSAGANLAAAVSLLAIERGEFQVSRQILLYPLTYHDHTSTSPFRSVTEYGTSCFLTSKVICDYMDLYAPNEKDRKSPYLAPLLSENLYNQPETLIITAEYDPLRDEGEAYGEKLRQFGNSVSIVRMKDTLHGFFTFPMQLAHIRRCYEVVNAFLAGKNFGNQTI